ncbi:MAG TPA: DUF1285 domain-containing protein [Xanthobacteraceae bacterium]|nr:DUF1285 domain-containing protein [Xanthobacteraceae bacterium]
MDSEASTRLAMLMEAARAAGGRGPAPVERWSPPDCGDIDMRIDRDGVWHYAGSPINRPALVRLFASVLTREADRYVLVTPAEKVGITVEDAPFLAVEMASEGDVLVFRTNLDDIVRCGPENRLRFVPEAAGGLRPYVHVRRDLWARLTRAVYLDLVALAEERQVDGTAMLGIASGAAFFPMAPVSVLEALA